ncbi:MAG: hypothetical protein Q9205_007578 [Flavoplaca limonia]
MGRLVRSTRNFSSQPYRKSWFEEPAKESWWSEPPRKPSAAARFAEKLVIGCICVGPVGYCLTLPAVKDRLNAKLKDLDIFGVEKVRGELEEHIRQSQKPRQLVYSSESIQAAADAIPNAAGQKEQVVNAKDQTPHTYHAMLHAAREQQKAKKESIEGEMLSGSRTPNPDSNDVEERLAAALQNPACRFFYSCWWESASYEERYELWLVALKLKYQFGFIWESPDENPWKG